MFMIPSKTHDMVVNYDQKFMNGWYFAFSQSEYHRKQINDDHKIAA